MIIPFIAADLREINPSVLAYIGDSVYELYSRCHVSSKTASNSGKMHKLNVKYVSAEAQAKAASAISDELKNASPVDYMNATGFEALLGYLFLDNQGDRLDYLVQRAFEVIDDE